MSDNIKHKIETIKFIERPHFKFGSGFDKHEQLVVIELAVHAIEPWKLRPLSLFKDGVHSGFKMVWDSEFMIVPTGPSSYIHIQLQAITYHNPSPDSPLDLRECRSCTSLEFHYIIVNKIHL